MIVMERSEIRINLMDKVDMDDNKDEDDEQIREK